MAQSWIPTTDTVIAVPPGPGIKVLDVNGDANVRIIVPLSDRRVSLGFGAAPGGGAGIPIDFRNPWMERITRPNESLYQGEVWVRHEFQDDVHIKVIEGEF